MSSNSVVNRVPEESIIKTIEFNQDYSCLCVGTKTGWSLVNILADPIKETFSINGDAMCCIGRLFTSSLVTLVSVNDVRKLNVYHSKRNHIICTYRYPKSILSIKLNRKRLVICLEDAIYIHNILDMSLVHKIEETPMNRNGVIALSPNDQNCYFAFPGNPTVGSVYVFDCTNLKSVNTIMAHDGLLAALEFNSTGTVLATASVRGTVIRVFSVPNGAKLIEFRRGLVRNAQICSLSFSQNNAFLVAASNTTTIHVFKLDSKNKSEDGASKGRIRTVSGSSVNANDIADDINFVPSEDAANLATGSSGRFGATAVTATSMTENVYGWISGAFKASTEYMPAQISEVLQQDRSFVTARLPNPVVPSGVPDPESGGSFNFRKIAAIHYIQNNPLLLVACMDGWLYSFTFDAITGGEATFVKQQCFIGARNSSSESSFGTRPNVEIPPGIGVVQRTPQNGSFASVVAPVTQTDWSSSNNPSPSEAPQQQSEVPLVTLYDLAQGEILSSSPRDGKGLSLLDHNEYPPIGKGSS